MINFLYYISKIHENPFHVPFPYDNKYLFFLHYKKTYIIQMRRVITLTSKVTVQWPLFYSLDSIPFVRLSFNTAASQPLMAWLRRLNLSNFLSHARRKFTVTRFFILSIYCNYKTLHDFVHLCAYKLRFVEYNIHCNTF